MNYQENLLALERKNSLLSMKLRGCGFTRSVKQGSLKLSFVEPDSILFVYRLASLNSLKELEDILNIVNVQVIILEKTLEEFTYFLSLEEMSSLLNHPNFECYLLEDFYEELYLKIAWQSLFFKSHFITAFEEEDFFSFKEKMRHYLDLIFLIASEFSDYGKKVTRNFYLNLPAMKESKKAASLKFLKVPAVICGAGPSLSCQLELLKSSANKALIFAGGSLLSALPKAGISPHFGAMVDPDPSYRRFSNCDFYETPFLYQMRLSHQILRLIHGQKLLSAGSGEMAIESYYTEMPLLESGWNVANFMATVAAEMGCDPIVLIGMDMSYELNQEYVKGVESLEEDHNKKVHLLKTMKGKKVFSRKDLLMGKQFFSELNQRYPHLTFINATEEGLIIENMRHASFEDVIHLLDKEYDLKGMIHTQLMQMEIIGDYKNSSKNLIEDLRRSFENTTSILSAMVRKMKEVYLHQKDNPSTTVIEAKLALEEIELEEELIYQRYLNPLWEIWKWVIFRNQQKDIQTLAGKIKQLLFFKEVIKEHQDLFNQCIAKGHKKL